MRTLLAVLALVMTLGMSPAAFADERSDLVKDIATAAAKQMEPQIVKGMPAMLTRLGADDADLSKDERAKFESGMLATFNEVTVGMFTKSLSDPARFTVEELRSIKTFQQSPAGEKWGTVASTFDSKDPDMVKLVLAAMLKHVDMNVLVKVSAARSARTKAN